MQSHPAVIEAGKKALDEYGAGLSSVRFICGTQVCFNLFLRKMVFYLFKYNRVIIFLYSQNFCCSSFLFIGYFFLKIISKNASKHNYLSICNSKLTIFKHVL